MRSIQEKGKVSLGRAVKDFFKGYIDFKGKSTRAGYWWIQLFIWIFEAIIFAGIVSSLVMSFPLNFSMMETDLANQSTIDMFTSGMGYASYAFTAWCIIGCIGFFAFVIPSIALAVRRFRDAGVTSEGIVVFAMIYIALFLTDIFVDNGPLIHFFWLFCMMLSFVVKLLPSDYLLARGNHRIERFFFRQN